MKDEQCSEWFVPKPIPEGQINLYDFQKKVLAEYMSTHPLSIPKLRDCGMAVYSTAMLHNLLYGPTMSKAMRRLT